MDTIAGTAAGVPFTALPPSGDDGRPAPLVVTWHMLDAPRSPEAFAAALPLAGVPAWRVHLAMPMCGARMVDGRMDAALDRVLRDPVLEYLAPFVRQAAGEFPAALDALRDRLPVDDAPPCVLGGSLGGAVALEVLTARPVPVRAVALVNPAVRARTVVPVVEAAFGLTYAWTGEAHRAADGLDFVARAADVPAGPPVLLVSGERDVPASRADARELMDALRRRYPRPDDVAMTTVPGLAHPLADEPGIGPAPQRPDAAAVDAVLTRWFREQLGAW